MKKPFSSFASTFCFLLLASTSAAEVPSGSGQNLTGSTSASQAPRIINLGDSISAAFLGETWIAQSRLSPLRPTNEMSDNSDGADDPETTAPSEELLPPMIWEGIRFPTMVESKSRWSWASGSKSNSIVSRVNSWWHATTIESGAADQTVQALNMAESGAEFGHIPRQIRLAQEDLQKNSPRASVLLATMMVGSNNACDALTQTAEEKQKLLSTLRLTFDQLAAAGFNQANTPLPVFVSSVPSIPDLGRPEILDHKAYLGMNCRQVREKIVDFCPLLVHWNTEDEYRVRLARVEFINSILRTAVAEASQRHPNLNVHFDRSFYDYKLAAPLLAADCFHPGRSGHTRMAEILWQSMPWFNSKSLP